MSPTGLGVGGVVLALLTVVMGGAGCGADTRAPTIGCAPLDGGTITDAGHSGGSNAPRVNGCQPGIISSPPGATFGDGGLGSVLGSGGATGDGGALGAGGTTSGAGGSLVMGFGGSTFGVGGALEGFAGSLNFGTGG